MIRKLTILLALLACVSTSGRAQGRGITVSQGGERRVALVIGNGAYRTPTLPPLKNPVNDAEDIAAALRSAGFQVDLRKDLTHQQMEAAARDFSARLGGNTVGLFYFAGHGVQVNGQNYLMPVDANVGHESEVRFKAVDAEFFTAQMEAKQNPLNIVILDACRNNPLPRSARSGGSRGLASINAPRGTLIAYSTAPGEEAQDGTGRNSPYAAALIQELRVPGVPIETMFRRVRNRVLQQTGNRQSPWESNNLVGDDFFLVGGTGTTTRPEAVAPPVENRPAPSPAPADQTRISEMPSSRADSPPVSAYTPPPTRPYTPPSGPNPYAPQARPPSYPPATVSVPQPAPGSQPRASKFTTPARTALVKLQFQEALQHTQRGLQADPNNPQHHLQAGEAYIGLGDVANGGAYLAAAERAYPAYVAEVEPIREEAWAKLFNDGVTAYNAGNMDRAIQAWESANAIYQVRPEGFQNLAALYTRQGLYDRAVEAYRGGMAAADRRPSGRALSAEEVRERAEGRATMLENLAELLIYTERFDQAELALNELLRTRPTDIGVQSKLASAVAQQPGRAPEAMSIYNRLLGYPSLRPDDLMSVGVALFNSKQFGEAARAFERLTAARPNSRDAWYNYANALYAASDWSRLNAMVDRLVQVDPLNENSALIAARASRESSQNQRALQFLQTSQSLPLFLDDLSLSTGQNRTTLRGRAVGNRAAAGTPVTIRFTFFSDSGQLGSQTVTVSAPASAAKTAFEVVLDHATPATGYRYELVR